MSTACCPLTGHHWEESLPSLLIPECIFTQWKHISQSCCPPRWTLQLSQPLYLIKDAPNSQSPPWPFNGLPCLSSTGEPAHHQTQNSTCGFTKAALRGKITSINLLTTAFPEWPRRLFASFVTGVSAGSWSPDCPDFFCQAPLQPVPSWCAGAWGYSCLGQDSGLPLADLALFDTTTLPRYWAKFWCWVWKAWRVWREEMRYEWYSQATAATIPVLTIYSFLFL